MFSSRLPAALSENRLARALASMRADGSAYLDLTVSNPTTVGLGYPTHYLNALTAPAACAYEPQAFGLESARTAVAREYARHHALVDPSRVILTASTSDAYSFLFKLLCDAGDEILVPQPGYPLFDHLVRLEECVAVPYQLEYSGRWALDTKTIDETISSRTRAILAVSPNNPTGSFLTRGELDALIRRCTHHDLALIVDEVFADYVLADPADRAMAAGVQDEALVFSLGGLSKSAGLPHVKLAWIVASGPAAAVGPALERLEVICDTYLSVSTPVQHAVADLLAAGQGMREQIHSRLSNNLATLKRVAHAQPGCELLRTEGGWYAVLRVPALRSEEDLVLMLLTEHRVLVHPGYFFDFPHEAFLVLSLLPEEEIFAEAIARVFRGAIA